MFNLRLLIPLLISTTTVFCSDTSNPQDDDPFSGEPIASTRVMADTSATPGASQNDLDSPGNHSIGTIPDQLLSTSTESLPTPPKVRSQTPEGYVSIDKQPTTTFVITGGMFETLMIPISSLPYTIVNLSSCSCVHPLDASTFQHNQKLLEINFERATLNLRGWEEKLGDSCAFLKLVDFTRTTDSSIPGEDTITPERFAQIAHPHLMQRILNGECKLRISKGDQLYTLEEMTSRFLSSIVAMRSLQKADSVWSVLYTPVIEALQTWKNRITPQAAATAAITVGLNAASACIGL